MATIVTDITDNAIIIVDLLTAIAMMAPDWSGWALHQGIFLAGCFKASTC
jgi:hypothetical protein